MQFTIDVRGDVISRDGVMASVETAVTFRASLLDVLRRRKPVIRAVRSSLRSVVGRRELEDLLQGDDIGLAVLAMMSDLSVTAVQVLAVQVPEDVRRALALEVVAERERRAKLIGVEAEFQASARRAEAAAILLKQPGALYLAYLETLRALGNVGLTLPVESPQIPAPPKSTAKGRRVSACRVRAPCLVVELLHVHRQVLDRVSKPVAGIQFLPEEEGWPVAVWAGADLTQVLASGLPTLVRSNESTRPWRPIQPGRSHPRDSRRDEPIWLYRFSSTSEIAHPLLGPQGFPARLGEQGRDLRVHGRPSRACARSLPPRPRSMPEATRLRRRTCAAGSRCSRRRS